MEFEVQPQQIMPLRKKRNAKVMLIRKVNAVERLMETGNLEAIAREYNIQPSELRHWRKNYSRIKELAEQSPLIGAEEGSYCTGLVIRFPHLIEKIFNMAHEYLE